MGEQSYQADQAQLCAACQSGLQGDISRVAVVPLGKPKTRIPHHSSLADVQNAVRGGCFLCTQMLDEIGSTECTRLK